MSGTSHAHVHSINEVQWTCLTKYSMKQDKENIHANIKVYFLVTTWHRNMCIIRESYPRFFFSNTLKTSNCIKEMKAGLAPISSTSQRGTFYEKTPMPSCLNLYRKPCDTSSPKANNNTTVMTFRFQNDYY